MRLPRLVLVLLPMALAPGCVLSGGVSAAHGHGYGPGYYGPRPYAYGPPRYWGPAPYYAPRPYYAPHPHYVPPPAWHRPHLHWRGRHHGHRW